MDSEETISSVLSELYRAQKLYLKDPDICYNCGGPIEFCDACETCHAPYGDCFDLTGVATCTKCLGCEDSEDGQEMESDNTMCEI